MADDTKLTISIETILKGLAVTTRGLDAVEKKLRTLSNLKLSPQKASTTGIDKAALATQRLLQQQQRLAAQSTELANRQERARQAAERLAASQQRAAEASAKSAKSTRQNASAHVTDFQAAERAAEKLRATLERLERQAAQSLQRQRSNALFKEFQAQEQAAKKAEQTRAREAKKAADAEAREAKRAATERERAAKRAAAAEIREAKRAEREITATQRRLLAGINSFGNGLRSFGQVLTVGLTAPLTALGILATRNAVELDSLKRGLEAITGSAEEAGVQLSRLRELAKLPGLGFQEAIKGSISLQAVGVSAEVAEKSLKEFANAVAFTGGGRAELERITIQLAQLSSQSKVLTQDLRPIIQAAPAVGTALKEAFGTVNAEDIEKQSLSTDDFLDKLLIALGNLPRAAAGAKNAFENFSDSIFLASSAIGDAILPPITRLINFLEPIILELADTFRGLSPEIQTASIVIAGLAAAAGPVLFVLGGIVTGIGTLITALGGISAAVGSIGLPALAAILASVAVTVGALTAGAVLLFKAWQTNFLGIRGIVTDAANAVLAHFGRIKKVFDEATSRILPTLQSITTKVLRAVTELWDKYGKDIVAIVGKAFRFVSAVTEGFLKQFANFVDLVLKLIDGDWKGAWNAFARIIINAIDALGLVFRKLHQLVARAFARLLTFIIQQAAVFAKSGDTLALKFSTALADKIAKSWPAVRDALIDMLEQAINGLQFELLAAVMVARLIASLRKAAAEGAPVTIESGGDISSSFGTGKPKGKSKPKAKPTGDKTGDKAAKTLRDLQDKLREAQDEFTSTQEANRIALVRAGIDQQFELTKDGLSRELSALERNFEDRLVVVRAYFAERKRLQEAEIDAELTKEKGLSNALFDEFAARRKEIEREFKTATAEIEADPKLKGRAKTLALQTAEQKKQADLAKARNEFETQNVEVSTRILNLEKQRGDIAVQTTHDEKELTKEIQKQQELLKFDLLEEQGFTADAAAERLRASFQDALKEMRVDLKTLPVELQDALANVDLGALKSQLDALPEPVRILIELFEIATEKARIAEGSVRVDQLLVNLRLEEEKVQDRILDGVITEREGRAEIVALQRQYKALLLDTLQGELIRAERAKQFDEAARIKGQILEVQRLGKAIDEVGQQLNQELFSDIETGFANVFSGARKGIDGVKDALIGLGESLLDTLNKLAAQSLTEQLFGGLLKPDSQNTQGTIGGFLSKLFGLAPKEDPATTANTTATDANTAAINSLTTTFGGQAAVGAATGVGGIVNTVGGIASTATGFISSLFGGDKKEGGGGFLAGLGDALGGLFGGPAGLTSTAQQGSTVIQALNIVSDWLARVVDALKANTEALNSGSGGSSGFDLGSLSEIFAGAATGDFVPSTTGGRVIRVAEGGYPEAVLTTDPKHAQRQAAILREYLARTKGLFGRFTVPEFAAGGFASARDVESNMLNSIALNRSPSFASSLPADIDTRDTRGRGDLHLRQILVDDERDVANWVNSSTGEKVMVDFLHRQTPLIRKLSR